MQWTELAEYIYNLDVEDASSRTGTKLEQLLHTRYMLVENKVVYVAYSYTFSLS